MDNNELDNIQQDSAGIDTEKVGIGVGIAGALLGLCMWIKSIITSKKLKEEREKNALYQEAIRMHQAEINALKNDKEREAYKELLWEEIQKHSEE